MKMMPTEESKNVILPPHFVMLNDFNYQYAFGMNYKNSYKNTKFKIPYSILKKTFRFLKLVK